MDTLFNKYPFPAWLFASGDEIRARISTLACSPVVWLFLKLHRCDVGKNLQCDGVPLIRMQNPGSLTIGDNVSINTRRGSNLAGLMQRTIIQCIGDGRIALADGSGLSGIVLSSRHSINIGNRTSLGANTRVYDHDFHSLDPRNRVDRRTDSGNVRSIPVEIGDDVLVGANVIILQGARIGRASVVGAGSVVTGGEYAAASIIAGNPARVISTRA
jgi:acetyltransferase-like isoleucine patch superfamily enzyme